MVPLAHLLAFTLVRILGGVVVQWFGFMIKCMIYTFSFHLWAFEALITTFRSIFGEITRERGKCGARKNLSRRERGESI